MGPLPKFVFALAVAASAVVMGAMTQDEARSKLRADLERLANGEIGEMTFALSYEVNPQYTDATRSLATAFIGTMREPDLVKRKAAQSDLLSKLSTVEVLTQEGLKNAGAAQAPAVSAVTAGKSGEPASAAPAAPATRPANRPPITFTDEMLFAEEAPSGGAFSMPAELTTEQAQALIQNTDQLMKRVPDLPKAINGHFEAIMRVVNDQVKAELWQRLVSGQGFKDKTIGEAWYALASEYSGISNLFQNLLLAGKDYAGVAITVTKLENVRMRLIGGKVTWGDEAFVHAMTLWTNSRISELEAVRAQAEALEQRLKTEGVIGR